MGDLVKRLLEYFRRNGVVATFVALAGLVSIWAVHLAGFFLVVPKSLWPFFDSSFFASFLSQFTLVVAASLAMGRYSPYVVSSFCAFVGEAIFLLKIARRPKKVNVLRRFGEREIASMKVKDARLFGASMPNIPFLVGYFHYAGRISGHASYQSERYELVIQGITSISIAGVLYLSVQLIPILLLLPAVLILLLPPGPLSEYFSLRDNGGQVGFFDYLRTAPEKFITPKKFVVIALSLSLAVGAMRHLYVRETGNVWVSVAGVGSFGASVVAKTGTGLVVFIEGDGYAYLSDAGYSKVSPEN